MPIDIIVTYLRQLLDNFFILPPLSRYLEGALYNFWLIDFLIDITERTAQKAQAA